MKRIVFLIVNKYFYLRYHIIYHDEFMLCASLTALGMFHCCRPNLAIESIVFLHRIWEIGSNPSRRQTILSELFRDILESLLSNSGMVPQI